MPRGDGTGPMGTGPGTGRGAGFCAGFAAPGCANPVGFTGGYGCGRGFRRIFRATGVPGWARYGYPANTEADAAAVDEKAFLGSQAEILENRLRQIKKRLSELNRESE